MKSIVCNKGFFVIYYTDYLSDLFYFVFGISIICNLDYEGWLDLVFKFVSKG